MCHSFYPSSRFRLVCAQDGCRRQFSTYSGFRKHLITAHEKDMRQVGEEPNLEGHSSQVDSSNRPETSQIADLGVLQGPDTDCFENSESSLSKEHAKDLAASIIAKLQGSGVANSVVSTIVCDLEELITGLHSQIKHDVLSVIPTDNHTRSAVEESLGSFENSFIHFNTETKRTKYFHEKWGVVEPIEIILGIRYDTRRNKKTGTYDQVPVKDTFVYIPILETLKFMCRNSNICKLLGEVNISKADRYEDFCDGSYFKTHPLFSKQQNALQIQLYYDDFETANPLGSKRGVHKIGALYFVLRNLAPKFNSAVMNIHLVALFHVQDLKKYGFDPILEPLINDIKTLESHGIDLPVSSDRVYGTICQISGDNLGMHGILGFTESFNGRYFCRLCLIEKADAQSIYSEDDPRIILRGRDLFEMHLNDLRSDPQASHVFGLKRNSTLNSLQFYHVCFNYAFDIMHDILEGVAQFEIKLLFEYLSENVLSKQDLLSRIYSFDYGYLERKNRPTKLNLEGSGNSIGLNSIQTLSCEKPSFTFR